MSREATRGETAKKIQFPLPACSWNVQCLLLSCLSDLQNWDFWRPGTIHSCLWSFFTVTAPGQAGRGFQTSPVRRLWPWRDISGCKTRNELLLQVQNPQQERGQRGTAEEQRDRHRGALIRHSKEKAVKSPCYSPQSRVLHSPAHAVTHRTSP